MAYTVHHYGRGGYEIVAPGRTVATLRPGVQTGSTLDQDMPCEAQPTLEEARGMAAWRELRDACAAILARMDMEPAEAIFPGSALRDQLRDALDVAAFGSPRSGTAK